MGDRGIEYGLMFRDHWGLDRAPATVMPREKAEQHVAEDPDMFILVQRVPAIEAGSWEQAPADPCPSCGGVVATDGLPLYCEACGSPIKQARVDAGGDA